jgi:hypothetical protein
MNNFYSVLFSLFAVLQIGLLAMISSSLIDIKSLLKRLSEQQPRDP